VSPESLSPASLSPASLSTVAHVIVSSVEHLTVDSADFHHVTRVLRARPGEPISVTNGTGAWRTCEIPPNWTDPARGLIATGPVVQMPPRRQLCVAVSLIKGEKPEFVVQKLTEAGIDRIVFLQAAHSVVKWDTERAAKHLARLRLVAREALMQSRGVWIPQLEGPVSTVEFVAAELSAHRVVVQAQYGGGPITPDIDTVLIGPEGGWSTIERNAVSRLVSLGDQIYRAETAALAAAVLLTAQRSALHTNRSG
jgi:16S rRNA (uracil1498-N3)-methyltransferase